MNAEPLDDLGWFRQPGPDFWPAVFWFWRRIPTQEEIRRQLGDMRDKGVGMVMIQARRALALEAYLSPAYLDAYRLTKRGGWVSGSPSMTDTAGCPAMAAGAPLMAPITYASGICFGREGSRARGEQNSPFLPAGMERQGRQASPPRHI